MIAPFPDPQSGFRWFESLTNLETIRASRDRQMYRLDRMRYLLERFGEPHLACPTIHVAGSKGKGSTAAFIASALQEAGFRTGLYTSPHVSSYAERIVVDGEPADSPTVLRFMNEIHAVVRTIPPGTLQVSPTPTTFELLTLLAFLVFRDLGCGYAVVEVGIGGRLDATNVILPRASVITPIELEHTDILGNTLGEIAGEKAGIIKPGVQAFSAAQHPEARAVIERAAAERGSRLGFVEDLVTVSDVSVTPHGTRCKLRSGGKEIKLRLRLPGRFQADNAALAFAVLRSLPERLDEETIKRGFARATLPGRMEVMSAAEGAKHCSVVLDGAHTPVSVARVAESFREMFSIGGVLLFGSVAGKRAEEMAAILAPRFRSIVISRPNAFKESDPEEVHRAFSRHNSSCRLELDPEAALRAAIAAANDGEAILVTGSFYMISEIKRCLGPPTERSYLDGRLSVVAGDITRMRVDAVVNAANSTLLGGSGVDGAIHSAGGPRILEECRAIRRERYPEGLPAGRAVVTSGGLLPARFVIHTVGPVYEGGASGEAELLRSAYRESLSRAAEIGASSVAFPAISTGAYGYPKEEAARIGYEAVKEFLAAHAAPEEVVLVFFCPSDASIFLRAARPDATL